MGAIAAASQPRLWWTPENYPERLIGTYERDRSPDRFRFLEGVPLPSMIGVPVFSFAATKRALSRFDALENTAQLPLVNKRIVETVSLLCPDDVQVFDARIDTSDGELPGFSVLNITHALSCLDRRGSAFTLIPGTDRIMAFSRLRFRDDCLGDHHLARHAEFRSHVLVSTTLMDALEALGVKGLWLATWEEIHPSR